jgi:hypothetical protein
MNGVGSGDDDTCDGGATECEAADANACGCGNEATTDMPSPDSNLVDAGSGSDEEDDEDCDECAGACPDGSGRDMDGYTR